MKFLESVKLVQFFLYEQTEIRLREITGIFGPNGGGKSAFLDAVQIAMFGANARLVALNAQADDDKEKSTRSLRSYCLGQYGDSPEQRIRDYATTYITLIWRDSETNEPLSMGVCLSASSATEKHEVLGRYILRGAELSMGDHIEMVDGVERPRDWRTFHHQLNEHAKVTGEDPSFPDSDRYIRAMLVALRGSGGVPMTESFTRAFRFALRMRFDKSVDQIVRYDVLEGRPTNIQRFKELTDSFKRLNEMVRHVEEKIASGEEVATAFDTALKESRKAASWQALAVQSEDADAFDTLQNLAKANDALEESLEAAKKSSSAQNALLDDARRDLNQARSLRDSHWAHKDHATAQTDFDNARIQLNNRHSELTQMTRSLSAILQSAADSELAKSYRDELRVSSSDIRQAVTNSDQLDEQSLEKSSRGALKTVSRLLSDLFSELRGVENTIQRNEEAQRNVDIALSRARSGKATVSPSVQTLQIELSDHGLSPIPICDLVRVKDPEWQPVIESYLGRHVEALLTSEQEEAEVFTRYRKLSGSRAIYGVKIAQCSKIKIGVPPQVGTVAALIEGDNAFAVAYLQRLLGELRCATSDADSLSGGRTLTIDGMLVGNGEFERIRPRPAAELKLGGSDTSRLTILNDEKKRLVREFEALTRQKGGITVLCDRLRSIPAGDSFIEQIHSAITRCQDAKNDLERFQARLKTSTDSEYERLRQRVQELEGKLPSLEHLTQDAQARVVELGVRLERGLADEKIASDKHEATSQQLSSSRSEIDFDRDYASDKWEELLSRHDTDYKAMVQHCLSQSRNAVTRRDNASRNGTGLLFSFQERYRESAGAEAALDWRLAAKWIVDILDRLRSTELLEYKAQAQDAYLASQETFRTDVAIALNTNIEWLDESLKRLNRALNDCPAFTNGERYQFVRKVRPQLERLLNFVKDIAAHGPHGDLYGNPGEIPDDFLELLNDKVKPGAGSLRSPLDDYREFFEFDINILREDSINKTTKVIGHLSKRLGPGSGGEHRAPLYIIAGAALASAYRLDSRNRDGLRLILLDEAFNKMDMTNIIATMRYFEQIGLQVFMVSPGENQGTLTAFLHRYYDLLRDVENNVVRLEGHDVSEATRALFREDLPEFNPDLMEAEVAAVRMAAPETVL
jgi:chromosome segregation protein